MSRFPSLAFILAIITLFSACRKDDTNPIIPTPIADNTPSYWGSSKQTNVMGRVMDELGQPIHNATISVGQKEVLTDMNGMFYIEKVTVAEKLGYVKVSKSGYFHGSRSFFPLENSNVVEIRLLSRTPIGSFSSTAGGSVANSQGLKITFQPGSIVKNGAPYTGTVHVAARNIDPTKEHYEEMMPGDLVAVQDENTRLLVSFGMLVVELTDDAGSKVNLAENSPATVELLIPHELRNEAPDQIDFWSFDENRGYWIHEGVATKENNKYVAEAAHFSWWNVDIPINFELLEFTVKDQLGNAVPAAEVKVTVVGMGTRKALTNANGVFAKLVPKNRDIDLEIFVDIVGCQYNTKISLHTQTVTPLTAPLTLPDIIVTKPNLPEKSTVYGKVVDCDNQPVLGYVRINNDIVALNEGNFSSLTCSGKVSITPVMIFPVATHGLTLEIQVPNQSSDINVGNLNICIETSQVKDIDGNIYTTVDIGNQTWMAQNLRTTRYSNGKPIKQLEKDEEWASATSGAWSYHSNNSNLNIPHGKLYNWYAVNDSRNVCPTGWHVPTESDWDELVTYLDPTANTNVLGIQSNTAGGQLKGMGTIQAGSGFWNHPNGHATNSFGFNALSSGVRGHTGNFFPMGNYAHFWSADQANEANGLMRKLYYGDGRFEKESFSKTNGKSVRCIKNR